MISIKYDSADLNKEYDLPSAIEELNGHFCDLEYDNRRELLLDCKKIFTPMLNSKRILIDSILERMDRLKSIPLTIDNILSVFPEKDFAYLFPLILLRMNVGNNIVALRSILWEKGLANYDKTITYNRSALAHSHGYELLTGCHYGDGYTEYLYKKDKDNKIFKSENTSLRKNEIHILHTPEDIHYVEIPEKPTITFNITIEFDKSQERYESWNVETGKHEYPIKREDSELSSEKIITIMLMKLVRYVNCLGTLDDYKSIEYLHNWSDDQLSKYMEIIYS